MTLSVAMSAVAQDASKGGATGTATPASTSSSSPAPGPSRITGIETNRQMIAAEDATEIVITGVSGLPCALRIDFGDGTAATTARIGEASPFPLKVSHTFPKLGGYTVRATGVADGSLPACEAQASSPVHVSPAGSKIEYVTLSTGCPEGWNLVGAVGADKSFSCTPIPDASPPTNLIHCTEGMRYFAQSGRIGCRHPAAPVEEKMAKAKTPPKGKAAAPGKAATPAKAAAPAKATAPSTSVAKTTKPPATASTPAAKKSTAAPKAPAS